MRDGLCTYLTAHNGVSRILEAAIAVGLAWVEIRVVARLLCCGVRHCDKELFGEEGRCVVEKFDEVAAVGLRVPMQQESSAVVAVRCKMCVCGRQNQVS